MKRTPAQHHEAWISWRKKIVDENFPDQCSCRIGLPPNREFKKTKCCEVMSCGMAIKIKLVAEHRQTCKICSDIHGGPMPYLTAPGGTVDAKPKQ